MLDGLDELATQARAGTVDVSSTGGLLGEILLHDDERQRWNSAGGDTRKGGPARMHGFDKTLRKSDLFHQALLSFRTKARSAVRMAFDAWATARIVEALEEEPGFLENHVDNGDKDKEDNEKSSKSGCRLRWEARLGHSSIAYTGGGIQVCLSLSLSLSLRLIDV